MMVRARVVGGLAVPAVLLLAACGSTQLPAEPPAPETSTTGSRLSGPSTAPSPPGTGTAQRQALPVYYVADTVAGFRLYREFHSVVTGDPASDAVRDMLARRSGVDPDYRSYWPADTELHSPVRHGSGEITVDLTAPAGTAQLGAELAAMTVQQLVYTVQGALQSTDPVRILVEGAPIAELCGHVATAEPIARADQYATRSLVQINAPMHGAELASPFTVTGEAAAFEATVPWEVLRDGAVVRSGVTMSQEGLRFSPFGFPLTLEPGEYVVRVREDDPSGGEGRPPLEDTKQIRVTG